MKKPNIKDRAPASVEQPDRIDTAVALQLAKSENETATSLATQAMNFAIANNDDYTFAVDSIAEIKERAGEVEALRKRWVDPLNGVIKSINDAFRPVTQSLSAAEAVLKTKIVNFVNTQAVERDKKIQDASVAVQLGKGKKADALLAEAEERVVPRIDGVQMRTTWTGEVIDVNKIPREYLLVDEAKLRAVTRAKSGDPKIPGWKAYPTSSASISTDAILKKGAAE